MTIETQLRQDRTLQVPMQQQTNAPLAIAIIIGGLLVFMAALIMTISPLLWTDHYIGDTFTTKPVPSGCSIQTQPIAGGGAVVIAHCPSWVTFR